MLDKFYRSLYRIRRVEEEIARLYPTDVVKSPVHLSIGQEAVSVGVCQALRPADIVFGFYRSHALYLAKGGSLVRMIAELYGKATGCSKGKGGSMHLIDVSSGVMGTSAIVASGIPQAVGYAYAVKIRRKDVIVANFFGDGAVDEGVFHESVNFAAVKKLPIVFVCENNGYAINSKQLDRQPLANIFERARTYGIQAERIEEGNVMDIYAATRRAMERILVGPGGPVFLECLTYRWKEHVGPEEDFGVYRPRSEVEPWIADDQVKRIGERLDHDVRAEIEAEVDQDIAAAFEFALASPFPEPSELSADVYREG